MKISFDFDGTLSEHHIQFLAQKAINEGHDVYITTSRFSNKDIPHFNRDLFFISDKLGIKRESIRFCDGAPKYKMLIGFDVHYDDDSFALEDIQANNEEIKLMWCIDSGDILDFRTQMIETKTTPSGIIYH